jgi:formylglycine-generating enzyme required for sulfatase activity
MAGKVFINYRRGDSMSTAGRLHDRLAQAFGRKNIFMDVDHIPPGVDFVKHLNTQVATCDVFLAVIGPNWLDAKDDSGHRRIDNPDDFVTIEITAALARDIRVIPVMVDGAHLPKAGDLPEHLKPLLLRHAVELRNTQFGRDAEALVQKVREAFKGERVAPRRWLAVTASALLAVWIGLYQMGVPVWMPQTPGVVQPDTRSAEKIKSDADAKRVAEAKGDSGVVPLSPERERSLKPKDVFQECDNCPEMVVVPAGSFTMGSPKNETGRLDNEGPQRIVKIAKPFAVGKFHVTVDQFAAFVMETGYDAGSKCYAFEGGRWLEKEGRSWRDPGFAQAGAHPAVCLSWNDAKAYADWLAGKTGKTYRLLTEAEWEYAARARTEPGTYPRYSFRNDEKDLCRYGNGADQSTKSLPGTKDWTFAPCNDGYAYTSPVGSFAANGFALYDMQGNASQWTADCWHDSYAGAPSDGTAWTAGDCGRRVVRGGSWNDSPLYLRSAVRGGDATVNRSNNVGFRLARTLNP